MKGLVVSTLLAAVPMALCSWPEAAGKSIKYTTIPGYFLQDDLATDPNTFDYVGFFTCSAPSHKSPD
jgi:hypothetical protein